MATSPNYGWLEPDNTDLVKNGALAIRTLGNAIDTTMATMVPKSTYTAKGSIAAATGASTPANLAVGNNGETLVADSSTSTGLRWQGLQAAGRNKIINGAFDFWQRGTSSTNNAGYGAADRWYQIKSAGTVTWSRSTDVPTNPYFKYSMSMAGTSIQNPSIVNRMESSDSEVLAGQTVTLSFYAKSTAGSGMTMSWYTQYPGATDDWSSAVDDKNGTVTITTSWARYSVTLLASALATRGYDVYITRASNETSTTLITGVQLELGSVATPFTRAAGTIQGELAACQRYYEVGRKEIWSGNTTNATNYYGNVRFTVTKRTTSPTITQVSTYLSGFPSITINEIGAQSFRIQGTANTTMSGAAFSLEEWNASAEL